MAINPAFFEDGFEDRLQDLMDFCRAMEPVREYFESIIEPMLSFGFYKAEEGKPVLVAGDPERQHVAKCELLGGIPYHVNNLNYANELAVQCGVDGPKIQPDQH
jgi:hypothetical protein